MVDRDDTDVIQDIHRKIERERILIQGAQAMGQSTGNAGVQQRIQTTIRESQKNISYLEERMRELQLKRMASFSPQQQAAQLASSRNSNSHINNGNNNNNNATTGPTSFPKRRQIPGSNAPIPPPKDVLTSTTRQPYPTSLPSPKSKHHQTKLDLIKYDSPLTAAKIQHMLQQLQFKLEIEKQYREGIEKMSKLYGMEGDRKAKAEAESNRLHSAQKMQLLKQALKRYEDLNIGMTVDEENKDDDSLNAPNIRRPTSGTLQIRIASVKDVDHTSTSRFSRGPETYILVKVEDVPKQKTRTSRNDRWYEDFDMRVEKANEIEFTVCDKVGDQIVPVAFLWVRISDITEELRRKKVDQEMADSGWVSADNMQNGKSGGSGQQTPSLISANTSSRDSSTIGSYKRKSQNQDNEQHREGIEAWFTLEPAGQILLSMNFFKQNRETHRPAEAGGLARQGAIRQRKEEIHEMYGHKFIKQQFYQVMRCAFCGEFLKNAAGYQCEDCKYTCHRDCYAKVVTKCISKTNAETDPEEKLNHRIPHRFEPFTNISANWCGHCGYILPLGKKVARKCTECSLTCHAACAHLIPDFCGISNEMARNILDGIRQTKNTIASSTLSSVPMSGRQLRPTRRPGVAGSMGSQSRTSLITSTDEKKPLELQADAIDSYKRQQIATSAPDMKRTPSQLSAAQTVFYRQQQSQQHLLQSQQQQSQTSSPVSPTSPQLPRILSPKRSTSAMAAAAALAAGAKPSDKQPFKSPSNEKIDRIPQMHQQAAQYAVYPDQMQQQHQLEPSPLSPDGHPRQPVTSEIANVREANHLVSPKETQMTTSPPTPASYRSTPSDRKKTGLDDFNFLAVLGKGNFGKVMLAETKKSKQLFAIKVLKKEFIMENDEVESTRSEKRVFLVANKERHPFLLNLHSCFQTETRIYFVMEYIGGGDLMLHIQREQFSPRRAQFYAAEVLLALKYFHENGIIYRDLKLDNILLGLDGHIKIGDYGLCKEEMWFSNTTSTFCGTPEFMAPEVIFRFYSTFFAN